MHARRSYVMDYTDDPETGETRYTLSVRDESGSVRVVAAVSLYDENFALATSVGADGPRVLIGHAESLLANLPLNEFPLKLVLDPEEME